MTAKLPPLSTQIVAPSQTAYPALPATSIQDALHKQEMVEEEPYTIKCICDFSDDDGNTVLCETCDTWQHIECFYPDNAADANREDFVHSCADCKPRALDPQKAHERQKARLTVSVVEEETTDRKPKRPPSKNPKKKPKPTELQINGHSSNHDHNKHSNPHDQLYPPKRLKNTHKSAHSVSSQAPKRSPSYGTARVNSGHPPSPATTPPDLPTNFQTQTYSNNFLSLHGEQDVQPVKTNSFARLEIAETMSMWLRDRDRMRRETGLDFGDVFQRLPHDIESLKKSPQIAHKNIPVLPAPDRTLRWRYLIAPSAIEKDVPLIELNGQIGFQKDYCADPVHRWDELTSPLPFVFFHPMLPLYIDTRREGSNARYVRRSCNPNSVVDTFLTEGGPEYHFWLVSDRPIAAKEQITIPWDFRFPPKDKPRMMHFLGLEDEDSGIPAEAEIDEDEYNFLAGWINVLFSEYGGCACDLGRDCAFLRFQRNHIGKAHMRPSLPSLNPSNLPKKKQRKSKAQHTISPTSTGHATNSRAASEGHLEDVPENDERSQSGSARSKPPSRDMTPARQGSFDTLGILTEPTDRDKRKVAMVEDSFRRMEQQQPPKKKKRTSDGAGSTKSKPTTQATGSQPINLPNGAPDRRYVDAGTSRSKSNSPSIAMSLQMPNSSNHSASRHGSAPAVSPHASVTPRPNYTDAAVQTDPVEGEWYSESCSTPRPKKRIVSLSKRLLDNRHRLREEERKKESSRDMSAMPTGINSPTPDQKPLFESSTSGRTNAIPPSPALSGSGDVQMADAPMTDAAMADAVMTDGLTTDSPISSPNDMRSPCIVQPTGNVPAHSQNNPQNPTKKSPDLRVQMLPVPAFGSPVSLQTTATTPLPAGSPIIQSPFAASNLPSPFGPPSANGIANPSPVKKRMTLSDYSKRVNKGQAAKQPPGTATLKTSLSNSDDPKSAVTGDTTGVIDLPTADKTIAAGVPTTTASKSI